MKLKMEMSSRRIPLFFKVTAGSLIAGGQKKGGSKNGEARGEEWERPKRKKARPGVGRPTRGIRRKGCSAKMGDTRQQKRRTKRCKNDHAMTKRVIEEAGRGSRGEVIRICNTGHRSQGKRG